MTISDFLTNHYKQIPGVTIVDSHNPGLTVGILAITHGDELVGLKIFDYLINTYCLKKKIQKGKVILLTMNHLAYKKQKRFIDDNLNRITNKQPKHNSYEFQRWKEIQPILDEMDIVLDIHSFSNNYNIVAISDERNINKASQMFSVSTLLVDNMSKSGSIIGHFIRNGKEGYGIECGQHCDPQGYVLGKKQIIRFLKYHKIILGNNSSPRNKISTYRFLAPIKPSSKKFTFMQDFSGFIPLKENELFATDGKKEYRNNFGKNIVIGIVAKKPSPNDGAGFLFEKIK